MADRPEAEASTQTDAGAREPAVRVGASSIVRRGELATLDSTHYELGAELARGGMGRIRIAIDRRLDREVAIKELLEPTGTVVARFEREALITARLQHPSIVAVYEAGRWPSGESFYAMKLVRGRSLKQVIGETLTLDARLRLLPHVGAVADAMAYAHEHRILHRDLKPANVIVGEFGETVVIDWGLAKDLSAGADDDSAPPARRSTDPALTRVGSVMGTPNYMPPEQARGQPIDERADVYAIGAMLYHLLAGEPPYLGADSQHVLAMVEAGPPEPLAERAHGIAPDLLAIVTRAMTREPADRYPTARELAEDLRRFQTGRLVASHRYTRAQLVRRAIARHRGVVAVAAVSILVLVAVGVQAFRSVVAERDVAEAQRARAEAAGRAEQDRKRELVLLQARSSLRTDPTASIAWLRSVEIPDADLEASRAVIDEARAVGVARTVFRAGDWITDARFTPDGGTVVAAGHDGLLLAYDLRTHEVRKPDGPPSQSNFWALALSPDGATAAAGGTLGDVVAWPVRGGPARTLVSGIRRVECVRFDAAGRRLLVETTSGPELIVTLEGEVTRIGSEAALRVAVAKRDWTRRVALISPNQIAAITPHGEVPIARTDRAVELLALSPDGTTVVVHDGKTLWAVPLAGGPLRELVAYDAKINGLAWSADLGTLVIFGMRPEIVVVDVATHRVRELHGHTDEVFDVELARDGRSLVSASDDGTARVWSLVDDSTIVLRGHEDDVRHARLSADERWVVTSSMDGSVRMWPLDRAGERVFSEAQPIEHVRAVGGALVIETAAAIVRWDPKTQRRQLLIELPRPAFAVSRDGELAIVPGDDWTLEARRARGPATELRGHHGEISHVEIADDGRTAYSASLDGTLRAWDLGTGASTLLLAGKSPVHGFARSADGGFVVLLDDAVIALDPRGEQHVLGSGSKWCAELVQHDRTRERMFVEYCDHRLVATEGTRTVPLETGADAARLLATSDDGELIAAPMMGSRTVRVWRANGELVAVLRGHTDDIRDVALSPDGRSIATASWDQTVRVWDLASGRNRVLHGHTSIVTGVVWLDDTHLASVSRDRTLRIWDVPSLAPASRADVTAVLDSLTTARIDARDRPTTPP